MVCAKIGLNGDFVCDVCVDTSTFGDTPRLLLLLLLLISFVLDGMGETTFGVFVLSAVMDNLVLRGPNPFGLDSGVGDLVMVV